MKGNSSKNSKQKHQFKSYYCVGCKQRKPCQLLTGWDAEWKSYCCQCYYARQGEQAQGYNSYEEVLAQQQIGREKTLRQCQLLKSYSGCPQCGSKEVDAYSLFEENRLVCQPCLVKKEGGSSSPISFLEQSKWYRKRWGINLSEWLENYGCLPVNKHCADKWLKDKQHLSNCQCLEQASQEIYQLFSSSLKKTAEQLKECSCEISAKVRVSSDDFAWCEKCGGSIKVASKKRVVKNRNDPRFWGLKVKEKVLCGDCLEEKKGEMTALRRAKFNEYRKLGRL